MCLLQCWRSHANFTFPSEGYHREHYGAAWLLVGHHFNSVDDVFFKSMEVRFTNTEACVGINPFVTDVFQHSITVTEIPAAPTVTLGDFEVTVDHSFLTTGKMPLKFTTEHRAAFVVTAGAARQLWDFRAGPIHSLQTLCELMADDRQAIAELIGQVDSEERERVAVFFSQRSVLPLPEPVEWRELPFSVGSLGNKWPDVLARWDSARARFGPTFDHFFSFQRARGFPVEHQFLNLTQALESYHRRRFPERTRDSEETFCDWLKRLRERLAKEDFCKLFLHNEVSFKTRINELVALTPPALKGLMEPTEAFVKRVGDTRNYFTHYDNDHKEKAWTSPRDVYGAVQRLAAVLRVCFLNEIGIDLVAAFGSPWGNDILQRLHNNPVTMND